MKTLLILIKRNMKLFFKDKGVFFTSLITPLILLVLYITFLGNVYKNTFNDIIPEIFHSMEGYESIINGLVGSQLFSSLLAVSCITVAFSSNMIMVSDKVNGVLDDIIITPVKKSTLAVSYYIATFLNTFLVCMCAFVACLIYIACIGWYLTFIDVLLIILDILILTMFGTALSSFVNYFLKSQGQISAVGAIVSSCYGFICGAYMPISSFGTTLQKVLSFSPGTYGTSLLRNHTMLGPINALSELNYQGMKVPNELITGIKDAVDCNVYFFDNVVREWQMFLILILSVVVILGSYILINKFSKKNK